ncbi:hypothetical protein EW145_g491 [Phellinidium pouzarii]|uniref:Septation initiation network scaffold protein cdc11 n=1 Tax=Phellinidium pouzarii TaxID=167371 RepID=A0A4S4LNL6_9AGAM|nr:hypothetical protein EW145_g491 [Phellinidium pouzarii]
MSTNTRKAGIGQTIHDFIPRAIREESARQARKMSARASERPAWQTDDLADEWIEPDEEHNDNTSEAPAQQQQQQAAYTMNSSSMGTRNFGSTNFQASAGQEAGQQHQHVGTFVVREDLPLPNLPKTPGKSKGGMKDIFSPLQLEKMFEPPSPPKSKSNKSPSPRRQGASSMSRQRLSSRPAVPSKLSQVIAASFIEEEHDERSGEQDGPDEIMETDIPNIGAFGNLRPSPNCCFTFSVPRENINISPAARPASNNLTSHNPQAQSTPTPSQSKQQLEPNPNDSRLRLFQFQYDTYTRDHLSALVDSFGVSSPSNGSASRSTAGTVLPQSPSEREDVDNSFPQLRATKRLKLTPPTELREGSCRIIQHVSTNEHPIKRARDISIASNAVGTRRPTTLSSNATDTSLQRQVPNELFSHLATSAIPSLYTTTNSNNGRYSSLAFRQKAEDLMAKIKSDRRMFSERSDKSFTSQKSEDDSIDAQEQSMAPSPEKRPTSPLERRLVDKDNDSDPDPDPPSYAASIARSNFMTNPKKNKKRLDFDIGQNHRPSFPVRADEQGLVVMPIAIPDILGPADRVRSPNPTFLAPPGTTFSSMRFSALARTESINEDLNRLVSSGSTATTATTLTAGSGASGMKHAGPAQMVRIVPTDLPALPDRVGGMIFDHTLRRWVKERENTGSTAAQPAPRTISGGTDGGSESEDPFKDIESLRDDDSSRSQPVQDATEPGANIYDFDGSGGTEDMRLVDSDSDSEFDDADDAQLSTFTFDNPATGIVQVMTGEEDGAEMYELTDSELDDDDNGLNATDVGVDELAEGFSNNFASMSIHDVNIPSHSPIDVSESMPTPAAPTNLWQGDTDKADVPTPAATPRPRERRPVRPPRSALKSASVTPIAKADRRRSVSFSDGRKDGKILELEESEDDSDVAAVPSGLLPSAPSTRSKRIADMLEDLEESVFEDESPSKENQQGQLHDQLQPMSTWLPDANSPNSSGSSKRSFSRSPTIRSPRKLSPRRTTAVGSTSSRTNANATFLTECSFGVAHDRLVEVITDVQPFEPYWDSLGSVDLSSRKLDSVARLKEFLPKLDSLILDDNLLSWLSGVPNTVRTLSAASNTLTSLTSFGHLLNLENLDISYNDVDSLQQLGCLRHLREFRADGNKISSLDGLAHLDGLLKLSLQGNQLRELNFSAFRWSRLELLNLSNNRLENVRGIGALPALISINLDNNSLSALDQPHDDKDKVHLSSAIVLHKLRILRLSGNRLKHLDVARFPNLRTLYVDNNCLTEGKGSQHNQKKTRQRLLNVHRLGKLENFSARYQSGAGSRDLGLQLQSNDVYDVKRLYLSGNPSPLPLGPTAQACYNLVYLELAACRLVSFPENFSVLMPNVRALNLNYNFLETDEIARGLAGLARLRKLTVVGNRMTGTKALIKMLSAMGQNVEMLDFRMNPCSLGWYLPLLVHDKDDNALLQPSEPPKGRHHSTFPPKQASEFNGRGGNVPVSNADLAEARQRGIGNIPSSPTVASGGAIESGPRVASVNDVHPTQSVNGKEKLGPSHWETLDAQFRRGLPDQVYAGRLAYRGLVMRACPQIRVLDGVRIMEKERRKAEALLRCVLKEVEASNMTVRASGQR